MSRKKKIKVGLKKVGVGIKKLGVRLKRRKKKK